MPVRCRSRRPSRQDLSAGSVRLFRTEERYFPISKRLTHGPARHRATHDTGSGLAPLRRPGKRMTGELRSFRRRRLTPEQGKQAADQLLQIPIVERRGREKELLLDDPETLLPLLEALRQDWTAAPA